MSIKYRGFIISYEPKPVPSRSVDYDYYNPDDEEQQGCVPSIEAAKQEIDELLENEAMNELEQRKTINLAIYRTTDGNYTSMNARHENLECGESPWQYVGMVGITEPEESHSDYLLRQINVRKQKLLERLQEQLDELNAEKERLIMDGLAQEQSE